MHSSIRRGLVAVLSVMSILLGITAVASADNVDVDGDGVTPVGINAISLGTSVCANSTVDRTVLIGIRRTGGNNQSFQNGSTQTISYAGATGLTGVTASVAFSDGTTTVPGNWLAQSNGTMATDIASAVVTFQVGSSTGPISGSLGFTATGTSGLNAPLTRPGSVNVTGTVVNCDSTPPVITKTVTGTAGANGWYTSNVTVNWTVTDPESSVTNVSGCGSQTFSDETTGVPSSCSATSAGGTASDSVNLKIDKTGPTATLTPAGSLGDNGWYTGDVTVSTSGADTISGPVTCTSDQTLSDETTGQTVNGSCTNDAGLTTDAAPITVKIDKSGPTATLTPAGTLGNNGWYTSNVTVTASGTDSISEPVSCTASVALTSDTAGTTVDGTCTNNAGLATDAAPLTVKIDKTAPSVSVTGVSNGGSYTLGSVPAAGCSTTDALSGVATQASLSTTGGPVGSITATCSGGTDNAGNSAASASATYSVIYNWSGFRQPVDNMPAVNKAKAGSAIPVKFSLAGNQGLNIFAAGFPKSAVGSCDPHAVADPIDETVTAGSSSLSYDATADQYVYVWKTDKAWTGCRTLTLRFVDGKSYHANFQFTK